METFIYIILTSLFFCFLAFFFFKMLCLENHTEEAEDLKMKDEPEKQPPHWTDSVDDIPEELLEIAKNSDNVYKFNKKFHLGLMEGEFCGPRFNKQKYEAVKSITGDSTPPIATEHVAEPTISLCKKMISNPENFEFSTVTGDDGTPTNVIEYCSNSSRTKKVILKQSKARSSWFCWYNPSDAFNEIEIIVINFYANGLKKSKDEIARTVERINIAKLMEE